MVDKDRDEAKTPLRQVSILLLKKKKKISPMSNASTVEGRAISLTSVFKRKTRSQKTGDSLDDFCVNRLMWRVTLLSFKKKSVLALLDSGSEVNAKKLGR